MTKKKRNHLIFSLYWTLTAFGINHYFAKQSHVKNERNVDVLGIFEVMASIGIKTQLHLKALQILMNK